MEATRLIRSEQARMACDHSNALCITSLSPGKEPSGTWGSGLSVWTLGVVRPGYDRFRGAGLTRSVAHTGAASKRAAHRHRNRYAAWADGKAAPIARLLRRWAAADDGPGSWPCGKPSARRRDMSASTGSGIRRPDTRFVAGREESAPDWSRLSAQHKRLGVWWKSLESRSGAGEGNRTLVVSLGSFCSTIELHPQWQVAARGHTIYRGVLIHNLSYADYSQRRNARK